MNYDNGPFVEALCAALELDRKSQPALIRSNTNLIYDVGPTVLRLTPNAYRSRDEVIRELHWLEYVDQHIADVVQLTHRDAQQFVFAEEHFTVVEFEKIDGRLIEKQEWNAQHFERLGALTGRLHAIGQDYAPPVEVDLLDWDRIPEADLGQWLPDDERDLPQLNDTAMAYLKAMPRIKETYGPIHYDIHSGNYLVTPDGRMVLLDFENSCRGHYINDISVLLYYAGLHDFSGDDADFNQRFLTSVWKGYERAYAVPQDEWEHIPWLLLNRSLIVYGYILKIWPNERSREQEAHVKRISQSVEQARALLGM